MATHGVTEYTNEELSQLFTDMQYYQSKEIIASGEGELKRGTILGRLTATNELAAWDPAASDGSEVATKVLGDDVDATAAAVPATVFAPASFRYADLIFAVGTPTAAQKKAALLSLENVGCAFDVIISALT